MTSFRSSTDSKLTLEENDKVEKGQEELLKTKHEINMDDMISYDSSANQNLVNPFKNIDFVESDAGEEKDHAHLEQQDNKETESDQKLFKNASLNHIDSEIE